jgi:hypothetical protein
MFYSMLGGIARLLGDAEFTETSSLFTQITSTVNLATIIVLAICGGGVTVYAAWIGYKFMTAKDEAARGNAKSQLIYAIVGLVTCAIVATIQGTVLPDAKTITITSSSTEEAVALKAATDVLATISTATKLVMSIATTGMTVIGVWIGWQFMRAEDDAKRKEAKTKLIYLFVGLIALVVINTVATNVLASMITEKLGGRTATGI